MTIAELVPSPSRWSGGKVVVVDQAGAVDRLPGSADVDPYWRLSAAFLLGYRENSRKAYRHDLEAWWSWCGRFEVHPFDAQRHHVNAWVRSMEQSSSITAPLASSTIRRRLSAVSKFYKYGISVEVLTYSPVDQVGRPQASEETHSIGLSSPEVRNLLQAAAKRSSAHLALITLLVYNGLRIDEALGADVAGYTYSSGHRVLRITRKGNKAATVTLAPATAAALDDYLDSREEGRTGPLFTSQRTPGTRLPYRTAYDWVGEIARAAKLPAAALVTPHTMRHTFITESLAAGAPLQDVQDAAGHKDPATTRRYDRNRLSHDHHPTFAFAARVARATTEDDLDEGPSGRPTR